MWATAFQTSEPREKEKVAVIFGSTNEILRTVQATHGDNATSALQWVLVPLDMTQDLLSLGKSILLMQFPCLSHTTTEI
jgi:hypothetical protein